MKLMIRKLNFRTRRIKSKLRPLNMIQNASYQLLDKKNTDSKKTVLLRDKGYILNDNNPKKKEFVR